MEQRKWLRSTLDKLTPKERKELDKLTNILMSRELNEDEKERREFLIKRCLDT